MRKTKVVKLLPYAICVLFIIGTLVFGVMMKYPISKSTIQIADMPDPPTPDPDPDPKPPKP